MNRYRLNKFIYKWKRRNVILGKRSLDILLGKNENLAFTPTVWIAITTFVFLCSEISSLYIIIFPSLLLFLLLILVSLIDIQYFIIADIPLYTLFLLMFLYFTIDQPDQLMPHLYATFIGYFMITFIRLIYKHLRKVDAIGIGDAKLYAFAGFCLGYNNLASTMIAAVFSAIISSFIALKNGHLKNIKEPVPFGPHLALGIWIIWVFGPIQFG
jgi:leader peptidase (prepilin peptidase)/N-methyltransferase